MSVLLRIAAGVAAAAIAAACWGQTPPSPSSAANRYSKGLREAEVDFAALDKIVGKARVVVFGEDSHEMSAEHDAIRKIFEHLASTNGFRLLVFESQWGVEDAFKDFMASDRTSFTPEESYFLDGAFASKSTARLLSWIRDFNRAHPNDRIRIAGFQPEQPVTDFKALWAYLDAVAPDVALNARRSAGPCRAGDAAFKSEFEFLGDLSKRAKAKQPSYSAEDRASCLRALDDLESELAHHRKAYKSRSGAAAYDEALLHIYSLKTYVGELHRITDDILAGPDAPMAQQLEWQHQVYETIDAARFQIYQRLLTTRYTGLKTVFWMHNWHAAKHASEEGQITPDAPGIPAGTHSIGERLSSFYGNRLVAIGSIIPCGDTCEEPKASLEPAFARHYGDSPAIIDLRSAPPTLPVGQPGALFANYHGFGAGNVVLKRQYDGLLYLPSSASTRGEK